jgi:hypothetical protein
MYMPGRQATRQLDGELGSLEVIQVADPENFQVALIAIQLPIRRIHQHVSNHARQSAIFQERALLAGVLAKNASEKLSVCVHGCDHTRGEFAARSADLLDRKLKTARCRMQSRRYSNVSQ